MDPSLIWFGLGLILMIVVGHFGGRSEASLDFILGGRSLRAFAIGLSAASTGNSGFIMLGAVGLGYGAGITFVFLPLAWLLGDLVFWKYFPERLNHVARETESRTLPDLLAGMQVGKSGRWTRITVALFLVGALVLYAASQYQAAGITLEAAYGIPSWISMSATAGLILLYSLKGGFQSSVWTDILQSALMIGVTCVALASVAMLEGGLLESIRASATVAPELLVAFPGWSPWMVVAFFVTFALSALGFGVSQPQVTSRYFAGESPLETRRAKWVYIGFLQFTWIGMTLFGLAARSIVSELGDLGAEVALVDHAMTNLSSPLAGFVLLGVFAAVASTLDSIGLSAAALISENLVRQKRSGGSSGHKDKQIGAWSEQTVQRVSLVGTVLLALALTLSTNETVFALSAQAVTLLVGTVASSVILRLYDSSYDPASCIPAIFVGAAVYFIWDVSFLGAWTNGSFPGGACVPAFVASLIVGYMWSRLRFSKPSDSAGT